MVNEADTLTVDQTSDATENVDNVSHFSGQYQKPEPAAHGQQDAAEAENSPINETIVKGGRQNNDAPSRRENREQVSHGSDTADDHDESRNRNLDQSGEFRQRQPAPSELRYLRLIYSIVTTPKINAGVALKTGQADVIARLVNMSSRLTAVSDAEGLYRQAILAGSLLQHNPNLVSTVGAILDDIDFSTSRNSPIYMIMRGLLFSILGALALCSISIVASSVILWISGGSLATICIYLANASTSPIAVAIAFGLLGSVVSILLRLSEFEQSVRRSRQFLLLSGAMLPLVGSIFACVTCAMFASGIINFNFAAEGMNKAPTITSPYFYMVVGFLSGFSERFTRGLLGTAEKTVAAANRVDTETRAAGGEILEKTSRVSRAVETMRDAI